METTESGKWKKLFYISLIFNFIIIISFLFFSFLLPTLKSNSSARKSGYSSSLSEEQKAKIEEMKKEYRAKVDLLWKQVGEDRTHLWEELLKDEPDSNRVNSLIKSITTNQVKVQELSYRHILRQLEIMTPAQRDERLSELLKRQRKKKKN